MKDYFWTTLFLLAVLRSAVAFKIPGLSGGGGGGSGRSPSGGGKPPGVVGGGNAHKDGGEYMGPVFIIRELDKDKGEYDAFITTGGIQEVKPPHPQHQQQQHQPHQHHQHQQHQQMVYQMNPAAGAPPPPSPDSAKDDVEDSEYFGVLITPDTVRTLDYPKSTNINVSLSVLLVAASSRMPWLLVLHRKNYPAFEYQQQPQPQPQQQSAAPGVIPGMQIPQRRRQYSPPLDRQRRGLNAQWSDGSKWDNEEVKKYYIADDDAKEGVSPLMFEQQVMATMCYNFEREYGSANRQPANEYKYDADETDGSRNWGYPVIKIKTKQTNRARDAEAPPSWIQHAIHDELINLKLNRMFPGPNLPHANVNDYTDEEWDRMFPKWTGPVGEDRPSTRATGEPAKKDVGTAEETDPNGPPEHVSPQPAGQTDAQQEPDRTVVHAEPHVGPFGAADEKKRANRLFSKRVEPQPTTKPLTEEEARAADKVFTRRDS